MDIKVTQFAKDLTGVENSKPERAGKHSLQCYYLNAGDVAESKADRKHHLLFLLSGRVSVSIGSDGTGQMLRSGEFILIPRSSKFVYLSLEWSYLVDVSFDEIYNIRNLLYLESLASPIQTETNACMPLPIRPKIANYLNHIFATIGGTLSYYAVAEIILLLFRQEYTEAEMQQLFYPLIAEAFIKKHDC